MERDSVIARVSLRTAQSTQVSSLTFVSVAKRRFLVSATLLNTERFIQKHADFYTNKKICKRASVRCSKILQQSENIDVNEDNFLIMEIVKDEEVITETNIEVNEVFQTHMTDHQYISFDSQQASQLCR